MADFLQTEGEEVSYKIDTTAWGGTPTSISAKVYVNGGEITGGVFPTNGPSAAGNNITLSPLKNLSAGVTYRIVVQFTSGGNVLKKTFRVYCEK